MDFSGFGSLMGGGQLGNGGMIGGIQRLLAGGGGGAAPAMPSDGAMQPTIGPGGAPAAAAPAYTPQLGLPKGGLLGILQGGSPQGIMGLLQHLSRPQAAPLAGGMPAAGMLSGLPGTPGAAAFGPVAPPPPQLPMNINPTEQF
jgi:hypothetical protein